MGLQDVCAQHNLTCDVYQQIFIMLKMLSFQDTWNSQYWSSKIVEKNLEWNQQSPQSAWMSKYNIK